MDADPSPGSPVDLLSQRVRFYQQAWQYYGSAVRPQELQAWAMLAVLLTAMTSLACLSHSASHAASTTSGKLQITAICTLLACVFTFIYFSMTKIQMANRDFAVQCANASVIALQQAMIAIRRSAMNDRSPPQSSASEFVSRGASAATTGPAMYAAADRGPPEPVRAMDDQDVVWAEFVRKLQRSMHAGAGAYAVMFHRKLDFLGGAICVGGVFGASAFQEVWLGGFLVQPVIKFLLSVVLVACAGALADIDV